MDLTYNIQQIIADNISSGDAGKIAELIVELLIAEGYVSEDYECEDN